MAPRTTFLSPTLLAFFVAGLPLAAPHERRRAPAAKGAEDWAWQSDPDVNSDVVANALAEAGLGDEVAAPTSPPKRGFLDRALKVAAKAASGVTGAAAPQTQKKAPLERLAAAKLPESPTPQPVLKQFPEVQQVETMNRLKGCVTIESPLAASSIVKRVAPVGSPCLFRADAFDEATHCMNWDGGQYGQYGWCWTKLDRSEWGSCSSACPMAGEYHSISKRLDQLEGLVSALAAVADSKLSER